jgi:hypothetical protein
MCKDILLVDNIWICLMNAMHSIMNYITVMLRMLYGSYSCDILLTEVLKFYTEMLLMKTNAKKKKNHHPTKQLTAVSYSHPALP